MFIVIDDIVDKETQDKIEALTFSDKIQWTFTRSIFYKSYQEVTDAQRKSLMTFTKLLFNFNPPKAEKELEKIPKMQEQIAKLNVSLQRNEEEIRKKIDIAEAFQAKNLLVNMIFVLILLLNIHHYLQLYI